MNKNIFFYRDRDKLCEQIYIIMKHNGFLNYFNCVNVETTRINIQLQQVPALLIYKLRKILYGQQIFNFLNERIQQSNLQTQQYQQMQQARETSLIQQHNMPLQQQSMQSTIHNQNMNNITNQQPKTNIVGYVESEMSGFSDNYTFSNPDINIMPQHTFLGSTDDIKIYTGNDTNKLTQANTKKAIDRIKEIRQTETQQIQRDQAISRNNKQSQQDIKNLTNRINEFVKKHQENELK